SHNEALQAGSALLERAVRHATFVDRHEQEKAKLLAGTLGQWTPGGGHRLRRTECLLHRFHIRRDGAEIKAQSGPLTLQRLDVEDGVIHIVPCCTHDLPPWAPLSHVKVDEPLLSGCCHVSVAFCLRDAWHPSERLHPGVALQRSLRQFPKRRARQR